MVRGIDSETLKPELCLVLHRCRSPKRRSTGRSDVATSCELADLLFLVCDTVAHPKSINQDLMVQYPGLAGKIRMMKLNDILSFQCLDTQHYRTQNAMKILNLSVL